MEQHRNVSFIALLHFGLVIFVYVSPFVISWKAILFLLGIYYLQLVFVKDCVLTLLEFGEGAAHTSFHHHYLTRLGFSIQKEKLSFALDYIIPWIVLTVALFWQIKLGHSPLLN